MVLRPSLVIAANKPVIMQIIVPQLNHQISLEQNQHNLQQNIKRNLKINYQTLNLNNQVIICPILFVIVATKKDILHPIVQILVKMEKLKMVMPKIKVNKKVTIHHG